MKTTTKPSADYGNWVTWKILIGSGALGILFSALAAGFPILIPVALFFLLACGYFAYARHVFSPAGGNLQARIRNTVMDRLDWDGRGEALDIGCGNGPLVIGLAKKHPRAGVTGIDYWGAAWDYSLDACIENAAREGVAERVRFQKASAVQLPFPDATFDAVVSNFVFHEVADVKDKRELIREALRVLKPGGAFSFQDLFLSRQFYGKPDALLVAVRAFGVERVALDRTNELEFIPRMLKLPFMVGEIGILHGNK